MKIGIQSDIKKFTKKWDKTRKKEIPSIIRNTLNDLAKGARIELQRTLPKYVDRPTKFTVNSVFFEETDKIKLQSRVGFLSSKFPKKARRRNIGTYPSDYMSFLIRGGTRLPKKKYIAVPTEHYKTNRYGNIKRNDIAKLLSNPKYFSGVSRKGNFGIYKRLKKKIKMVIGWETQAVYKGGKYPFNSIVSYYIKRNFRKKFIKNFKQVFARKGISPR